MCVGLSVFPDFGCLMLVLCSFAPFALSPRLLSDACVLGFLFSLILGVWCLFFVLLFRSLFLHVCCLMHVCLSWQVIGEVTGTDLDKLQELVEANRSGPSNVEMDDQEENEVVDDPRWCKVRVPCERSFQSSYGKALRRYGDVSNDVVDFICDYIKHPRMRT